jgi:hypothetical protein
VGNCVAGGEQENDGHAEDVRIMLAMDTMGPVEISCYLSFCYLAYGRVIGWLVPASISSHMFKYGFFDLFT